MKLFLSKAMIILGVLTLLMGIMTTFGINLSYADNLEIIGNEIGLEVKPSGTKLFNLTNMNPGDTNEAKIDIKNVLDCEFELFIRTERISSEPIEGEADIFKQMILTIYYEEELIYAGSMKNFAQSNISLGFLNPGDSEVLRATVYLPGPETGNEFQGKSVEVKWIFTAEQRCEPEEPQEPENPEEPEEPQVPEAPEEPKDPTEPTDPTKPQIPSEPDEPSEEIKEIDEVIPETTPETPAEVDEVAEGEEPIPIDAPELDEVVEIEEETPKSAPKLPKTGDIPAAIYYALGTILLGLGIGTRKKKEE